MGNCCRYRENAKRKSGFGFRTVFILNHLALGGIKSSWRGNRHPSLSFPPLPSFTFPSLPSLPVLPFPPIPSLPFLPYLPSLPSLSPAAKRLPTTSYRESGGAL
jgi:hypothetical protein